MKITIRKKGIVDCTSDSREYDINSLSDGIENALKIIESEVEKLDYIRFYVNDTFKYPEFISSSHEIKIHDEDVGIKLLNYFREHPDELGKGAGYVISIHVKLWNFFNDGNGCSDNIEIKRDELEVSCQDDYDPGLREDFHEHIEELIGEDYISVVDNNELISLHICATEKCSANCPTCYVIRLIGRELDRKDWEKLPTAKQYAIGGGEPSEYPLIAELVDYLKNERNGYVEITTNGQKIIDFNTLPDKIAISIDGLSDDIHKLTHNTDSYAAEAAADIYKNMMYKNMIYKNMAYKNMMYKNMAIKNGEKGRKNGEKGRKNGEKGRKNGEKGRKNGIDVCINSIVHRGNIDDAPRFAEYWNKKGFDVNFILFTERIDIKRGGDGIDVGDNRGNDATKSYGATIDKKNTILRPTYEQLKNFHTELGGTIYRWENKNVKIDSCMAGLLSFIGIVDLKCSQGLFSQYYRFGTLLPCSHSSTPYPKCKVMEEYLIYFFSTLRPMIFVYNEDGTSGAHEWAFKVGQQGKILHKIDGGTDGGKLRKDKIYVLTDEEEEGIKESHYVAYFSNKMPYWIFSKMSMSK